MIFRNPHLLWLLLLLPAFVLLWSWRGVRVALPALVLRLGCVALLIGALADPIWGSEPPPAGPLVILVDQSDSLSADGREALRAQAHRLARAAGAEAHVLLFGGDVLALASTDPAAPISLPDPTASNLAAAIQAARSLLPGGGHVLLLSDGLQTDGDALAEAQAAATGGITIDVVPSAALDLPEVAITSVSAPRTLRSGEEYPIEITASHHPDPQTGEGTLAARLRLWDGETVLGEQDVLLQPGDNLFTFHHTAGTPGVVRLRAELEVSTGDSFSANNTGAATALISPPPRVLVVAGHAEAAGSIVESLGRQGIQTEQIAADKLPTRLSDLAAYDGMVLVDVPAASLSLDQMAGVREFVRSEGRGLVALGGRNSFTLGAYKDTPLEEALPVLMDPPPRPERSDIALLLIVDRSASMTAAFGVSKFDMAKEAAILATESLQSNDRIGILAFDTGNMWVVPFAQIGSGLTLAQIQEQIGRLPSGGGTDIEQALAVGLPELAAQPTGVRHAVLLTDGRSFTNDLGSYQQLVETARAQQITLSTIAIGGDSDTALLDQLARWGGGRYYFADQPEDIPRLTLLESEIARANPAIEEPTRANLAEPHPIMRDFAPAELPQLAGYVGVTARDSADVVLKSPSDDPLLATWQYGLGRAVAWMPGVDLPWAGEWRRWADADRFWAQMVRYTLPEPDSGPLQVRLDSRPGGARLTIDALAPGGEPLDLAAVNARVTLPDGSQRGFDVRQTAPGRYTQDLTLPDAGAYLVSVALLHNGELRQRDVGYVQPVPAEYRPAPAGSLQGRVLLEAIARVSGGELRDRIDLPAVSQNAATGQGTTRDFWPWLLGAALGLWVLEIAVRRGVFVR